MARTVRMPSEADLPPGTVRDLVELMFYFYRVARRPTLRKISDTIRNGDYHGTASPETIRRMLHGTTVPAWPTVEAVFEVLCDLGTVDPNGRLTWDDDVATRRVHLERCWHRVMDEPHKLYGQPAPAGVPAGDPWVTEAGGDDFSDEPPF